MYIERINGPKDLKKLSLDQCTVLADEIRQMEEKTDYYEDVMGEYLVKLSAHTMNEEESAEAARLLHIIGDLERISDHGVKLLEAAEELHDKEISFSDGAKEELEVLSNAVKEICTVTLKSLNEYNDKMAYEIEPMEKNIDRMKERLRANHISRLQKGNCSIEAGFICSMGGLTAKSNIDQDTKLCIINTCTVTSKAEQKARRIFRLLLEKFPNAAIIVTGCYAEVEPDFTNTEAEISNGIDVSKWQANIDWKAVSGAGIDFAIIRAGRGDLGSGCKMDDYFVQNIKGATANGIDVGVYFYSYATTVEEAKAEAKFLLKIIKDYKITYPVILDMEEEMGQADVTAMIDAFFKEIMNAGYYPMFYSYKSWIETYLDMRILDKYAVWLAQTNVSSPTYEGGFYIWQYSHTGKVDGINGYVDLNISYRDFPKLFQQYRINNL